MKREMLFRIWNGQEMIYDVMVGKFGVFYVNPSNDGIDENDTASLSPFNTKYPDDIPVMQYTGLQDKNGNKIFEGDIVERFDKDNPFVDYPSTYEIIYGQKGGFHAMGTTFDNLADFVFNTSGKNVCTVVGNKYDN
jgi:uncharacterized phage protein (TIGR01671 family)